MISINTKTFSILKFRRMNAHKNKFLGEIYLLSAAFLNSTFGVFSRIIGINFGVVFQMSARFFLMSAFFFIFLNYNNKWKRVYRRHYKWLFLMVLAGIIAPVTDFVAFIYLSLGTAYFSLYASMTIFTYVFGYIVFKERLSRIKIYSLIFSFLGLYLIFSKSLGSGAYIYIFIMLLGGLSGSAWTIITKKVSSYYPVEQILLINSLSFAVLGFLLAVILGEHITAPSFSPSWLGLFAFSIVATLAHFSTVSGFKRLQAQKGSLILLLEPFFAAIVGLLLYKEALSFNVLIGGLLIVFGAALGNLLLRKKKQYSINA